MPIIDFYRSWESDKELSIFKQPDNKKCCPEAAFFV